MRRAALVFVLSLALLTTGCFNPFRPTVGTGIALTEAPPSAGSAQGVVLLFRWCWINRAISEYEELFTEDFQFAFSDVEAVDNLPILYTEEVDIARRLFVDGSTSEPRAKRIDLDFSTSLIPINDQRPDKPSPWHKQITTGVVLKAELSDAIWDVSGDVTFYLVRGDVAEIPKVLRDRGVEKDSHRWYIERWEDKTGSGSSGGALVAHLLAEARARRAAGAAPLSATSVTPAATADTPGISPSWGDLMALYR